LKAGIYESFQDYLENNPSLSANYKVYPKPRSNENWVGTSNYNIKYADREYRIKEPWGFCDGKNVFVLFQNQYFQVFIKDSTHYFKGFTPLNYSSVGAGSLLFGVVGGIIAADVAYEKSENNPTFYNIDNYVGYPTIDTAMIKEQKSLEIAYCYLYRTRKWQLDQAVNLLINDSISGSFVPNSYQVLKFQLKESPIKICYGDSTNTCVEIILHEDEDTYIAMSNSKNSGIEIKRVKYNKGSYDIITPRRKQIKRERKNLKESN